MMNSTRSCPEGYGPDVLFRFPLEPYFNEPYGSDCYFSYVGYDIFGGLVLAYAAICLLLNLLTALTQANQLLRIVAVVNVIDMVVAMVVVVLGWVAPMRSHIAFAVFMIVFQGTGFLWAYVAYQTLMKTVVRVEVKKDITPVSLLGGPVIAGTVMIILLVTYIITTVGFVGVAVSLSLSDIQGALLCYRILNASVSFGDTTFLLAGAMIISRFIWLLEGVMEARPKTTGATSSDQSSRVHEEMRDVAKRYRLIRRIFLSGIPLLLLLILHIVIVPVFWFLLLLHLVNGINSAMAVWLGITPRSKRRYAFRRMFFCFNLNKDIREDQVRVSSSPRTDAAEEVVAARDAE